MDHKINISHDGKIKILQLTDMQIIDADQRRTPDRIDGWKLTEWLPEKNEENVYSHIRYLVEKTNPDLIIITGDIIYGEFDDSGSTMREFCAFMDSLNIPWAPVFGNHDNETFMGTEWQCEMFENSKNCLFSRGNVFGNGNYSVGIYRGGELVRVLYMMDSNGCGKLGISRGFRNDQLKWLTNSAKEHAGTPCFVCFHIPTRDFYDANIEAGYQTSDDASHSGFSSFEIGADVPAKNGDFGKKHEYIPTSSMCDTILPQLKEIGADGVFAGHCHMANTSVLYRGIRFTYGFKTGLYDYYDKDALGGTLITLDGKSFDVEHILVPESMRPECRG
ncbi:MAG: metallophosphoesterase [Clostridia bacterium]|nr:metallophosphoesterase [Clostridia bacterium]